MNTLAAARPRGRAWRAVAAAFAAIALSSCAMGADTDAGGAAAAGASAGAATSTQAAPAAHTAVAPAVAPLPVSEIGLYELRVYTAAEGKLDALHARFRDHTLGFFAKHGITNVGYFSPLDPSDARIFYLLGYKDRATRDAQFRAFATDPEWTKVYQASQADGSLTAKIESTFLTAAEYSPAPTLANPGAARLFELRTYTAAPGKLENVHARFRDHTLGLFARHGMTNVLYWRPAPGQAGMEEKMVYLLAFPDKAARDAAWPAFAQDPDWRKAAADSQKDGPILLPMNDGGIVSVLLTPTDYSPLK
jgi:uncharacterized protein YbaA (DUF1428 family)